MIKLPLVGAAYKMQSQSISCQNCINWYPQTIEYPNGSRVAALMPTPGLKKVFSGDVAATRCLYVLSNGALLTVIGKKLYHSKASKFELTEVGSISALGTVRIADNGQIALIVNGTYTYSLNLKTLSLERLSGSTIPRSTHVLFLDGRFVVNKANTGQFYWSDLYSTTVNALSYATAESTPDNITAIITFNRELWLFGAQSVERYYGTGSSNSPFSRLSGGAMAFGCVAPDSIISLSTGVIWLGVSEFGGNQIVMSAGGLPERISTHALEEEISLFIKTSDASAYAYQQEGHVFYVISFPSANVTFCFDVSTGLWHQRSFANVHGLHERHRSQHHAYFNNAHIVGDYRNGKLYQLDNNTFTDDGELILRERTAQAVITDKKLTRFNQLQIVCETGFFGETKKVEPEPPRISCEGAINTAITGGIWLAPVMYVNGVFYNYIDSVPDLIDVEHRHENKWNWTNLTTENMRIRIEANPQGLYSDDEGWQINPNPTLDVNFETGIIEFCLAPKNDCEPIGADILNQGGSLEAQTYFLDYRLNDGDIQSVEVVLTETSGPFGVANHLFGSLVDKKGWKLFELYGSNQPIGLDGQTHPCPFRSYLFRGDISAAETIISSSDDYVNEPTTLEFILNPTKEGIDAVELYFGQTTVIHACSYKTWDGL